MDDLGLRTRVQTQLAYVHGDPGARPNGSGSGTARRSPLSPREQEVLSLVARGLTNIQIAKSLYLSPTTVKGHISMILRKLGVANRVQATALFAGQITA
ncbi:helix-turn-helix domain-containing protein [Streptomyces sp. S6]